MIRELLQLRQEEAELLGYRNFAELSLVPKMAGSPSEVIAFLRDLGHRARPSAAADLAELREFAAARAGPAPTCRPGTSRSPARRLKEARYAFSDEEVRQYFTLPKVLEGLFRIVETLFEVRIVASTRRRRGTRASRFYRIERDGTLVGEFFLDLYARAGKRPGAWMDDARARWLRADGRALQTPVAHLVCNFAAPRQRPAARCSRTTTSSRCSTSSATACTTCSRRSRSSASRASPASSGTPSSCRASSWRTSAGSGTCCSS